MTEIAALGDHLTNWRAMLARGLEAGDEDERIERALRSGRPMGSPAGFVHQPAPRGRPRKHEK